MAQTTLFWLGNAGGLHEIGIFCTSTKVPEWEWFGWIHAFYFTLFLFGCAALAWRRARVFYLVLLALSLPALPAQAYLLEHGALYCDGP